MFEIDKKKFGAFVAELRREQGYTQKELAQQLYISDKAVSKWETGASIPDVPLLIPLAELLHVTVTELLECRRIESVQTMDAEQVENIVKKAVVYSEESGNSPTMLRKKRIVILAAAIVIGAMEAAAYLLGGAMYPENISVPLMWFLGSIFGVYFWIFAPEVLPRYYDENRIGAYSDGFFRIDLPGIAFNNRNWPHLMWVYRVWTWALLVLYTPFFFLMHNLPGRLWEPMGDIVSVVVVLAALIVPVYIVAKKYE